MPKTIYEEDEIYLTVDGIRYISGRAKAAVARDLIKRLLDNAQTKDIKTEISLSKCVTTLDKVINDRR